MSEQYIRDPRAARSAVVFAGVVTAAVILYGVYLYRHICFAVGGSDSSGYANAARAIASGRLVEPIAALARWSLPESDAPAFIPLGYLRGPRPGTMSPLYPWGFPLHLALAGAIGGWEIAPYFVSPLAGLLAIAALYLLGRRLGLSRWEAAAAGTLLASCPVFVFQAIQPMSDVVATLWCLVAILCALQSRVAWRWSAPAGLALGIAVLVRPLDVLLVIPLAFAMPLDRRRIVAFLAGGLPAAAVFATYNVLSYGSPMATGYGLTGHWEAMAWANFPPRFVRYSRWTARILTPAVGVGWLLAVLDRRIERPMRAMLFTWFAAFFVFYCFYEPAGDWWFTRFLLPGLPALPLGFLLELRRWRESAQLKGGRPRRRALWVAVEALLVAAIVFAGFRTTRRLGVLDMRSGQALYPEGCRLAARALPAGSLVLASDFSGALRYYTPLDPVRWDVIDPRRFAALRYATEGAGVRWYALLNDSELAAARVRLPSDWTVVEKFGSAGLWRLEPATVSP